MNEPELPNSIPIPDAHPELVKCDPIAKVICAWCGKVLKESPNAEPSEEMVSHGICNQCQTWPGVARQVDGGGTG